jgi:hypothetical protein
MPDEIRKKLDLDITAVEQKMDRLIEKAKQADKAIEAIEGIGQGVAGGGAGGGGSTQSGAESAAASGASQAGGERLRAPGSVRPTGDQRDFMRGAATESAAYREEARRAARAVAAENAAQRSGMRMAAAEDAAYREEAQRQAATQRAGMQRAAIEDAAYGEDEARQERLQRAGMRRAAVDQAAYADEERRQVVLQRRGMQMAAAELAAYRENDQREMAPVRDLIRKERQMEALVRRVSFLKPHGAPIYEDKFVRALAAQYAGSVDDSRINEVIKQADIIGGEQNRRRWSKLTSSGETWRFAQALGLVAAGASLGGSYATAAGSGSRFRWEEHLGEIGIGVGALAGAVLPGGSFLWSALSGIGGNTLSQYFQGKRLGKLPILAESQIYGSMAGRYQASGEIDLARSGASPFGNFSWQLFGEFNEKQRRAIDALERYADSLEEAARRNKEDESKREALYLLVDQARADLERQKRDRIIGTIEEQVGRRSRRAETFGLYAAYDILGERDGSSRAEIMRQVAWTSAAAENAMMQANGPSPLTAKQRDDLRNEALRWRIEVNQELRKLAEVPYRQLNAHRAIETQTTLAQARQLTTLGAPVGQIDYALSRAQSGLGSQINPATALLEIMRQMRDPQGNPVYSREDIARQEAAIHEMRMELRSLQRERAYLPVRRAEALFSSDAQMVQSELGYESLLAPGGPQALALSERRVQLHRRRAGIAYSGIRAALLENDEVEAYQQLGEFVGSQNEARQDRLQTLLSSPMGATETTHLGRLRLGIDIASNDIATGGQVPLSLRRNLMGALGQRLSSLDYYLQQASPEERPAVEAAQMAERSSLLTELQSNANAVQFGEIGRMVNLTAGTTGDWTLFGPSIRDFQRINPKGSMAFGGSGEDVPLSPFAATALAPGLPMAMSTAMGGTSQVTDPKAHEILERIANLLAQKGFMAVSGSGITDARQGLNGNPYQSQAKAANGMPF